MEGAAKAKSEFDFIQGIVANLERDLDTMETGLTKAQRTPGISRQIDTMRERVTVMQQCCEDGIKALS
ncbi:hypothetical protein BAJUN_01390 [Bajunvirus bajun]|uniref:Uncharacterized protein n=1 Tax=Brevundimonas phage vB_BgoS-Bajun TaxID=2948594 RepID=A0A9E7N4T2_9CAUD|nr:hypothetical protein BAJUN_01390 [Brevundimonas phage vB_BgoS-Bajun]